MDIQNLKRDHKQVSAGQWIDDIPDMGDLRLKVRGMSSSEAIACRQKKERAVPRNERDRRGNLKPETAIRVVGEMLHEAVLLDWEGLTNKGKPVPYDSKLAKDYLTNPDFRQFADAVAWAAAMVDRGDAEAAEEAKGN